MITKTVRFQNSKKGHPRKVFRKGQAHPGFTGKGVTAYGGMALVAAALKQYEARNHPRELTKDLSLGMRHETYRFSEGGGIRTLGPSGQRLSRPPPSATWSPLHDF